MHLNEGAAVIAVGVVVVWYLVRISERLESISQQLENSRSAMQKLQGTGEDIAEELKSYNDTFAANLREEFNNLREEFEWYKDGTFAHELREGQREISTDITGELRDISKTLSKIENNTSQ
jgi:hypothetical protein